MSAELKDTVAERPRGTKTQPPSGDGLWPRLLRSYALVGAWIVVIVIFTVLRPDVFPTGANVSTMLGSQSVLLVLALGLIIPLFVGDFDLSIAGVLALSSMLTALLNVNHGWPIWLAVIAAIVLSALVGVINGVLIVKLDLDSFVVTLGTSTLLIGLVQWLSASNTVTGVAAELMNMITINRFLGVSLSFWYGVILTIVIWWVLSRTPLGQRMLFVGRGRSVARLSGLHVDRIRFGSFVASSTIAGLAGIIYVGTLGGADPSSGFDFLLPAFAAAYLGATAVTPGRFNAFGTLIAVYFLVTGITGLQQLGAQSFVQQLFYGAALIVAVALARITRKRSAAGGRRAPKAARKA
jgi:ribose transport system permease protein